MFDLVRNFERKCSFLLGSLQKLRRPRTPPSPGRAQGQEERSLPTHAEAVLSASAPFDERLPEEPGEKLRPIQGNLQGGGTVSAGSGRKFEFLLLIFYTSLT